MPTYIAFLRAINLGTTRKFPKDAIKQACESAGCTDVETYINTGNVRVTSTRRSATKVEEALEEAFAAAAGFSVPTVAFTQQELSDVAAHADRIDHPGKHYVSLLKAEPGREAVALLEAAAPPGERVEVAGRAVHLLLGENYHEAKLTNAAVEKHLGVSTNRNVTVIRTLAQKWGS